MPSDLINECGCSPASNDDSLNICVDINETILANEAKNCSDDLVGLPVDDINTGLYTFNYYQYTQNGSVYLDINNNPVLNTTQYTNKKCCKAIGGTPTLKDEVVNGVVVNSGYVCCDATGKCGCTLACKWLAKLTPITIEVTEQVVSNFQINVTNEAQFLVFTKPDNTSSVVTPDGCNCLKTYTIPVPNIVDPYTGIVGYGCQLTAVGLADLTLGQIGVIYTTYANRLSGATSCYNAPNKNNNILISEETSLP